MTSLQHESKPFPLNKLYHLSTCDTCKRIIKELGAENFELQDIKVNHVDEKTLDLLASNHGGYEAIFNKRARKYRSTGLHEMDLSEDQWKESILSEYTFIKRPIMIINGKSYVGNSKKVIAAAKLALEE